MKKIVGLCAPLAGIALALGLVVTSSSSAQAAYRMRITEIYYNSPGSDTGGNASLNAEWVLLHNTSGSWITMTDWILHDGGQKHTFTFGSYAIAPHGYVKIHTGEGSRTQTNRYWNLSWYVWNNTGDKAKLHTAAGRWKDSCSWGDGSGSLYC